MDYMKKRKLKKWFNKHKIALIATGSFLLTGLIAGLIGFEIANDWHAIQKWLSSPWAATFFICLVIGIVALVIILMTFINLKRGDE